MKYVVYTILFIVAFFLFCPRHGENTIHNLPLFAALVICIATALFVTVLRRVSMLYKIRKLITSKDMKIQRFSIIPNLLGTKGKFDITASLGKTKFNFQLLLRKRAYYRYHFEGTDKLEYYKTNRYLIIGSKRATRIVNITATDLVGKRKLPFCSEDNTVNVLIIDRSPSTLTDSVRREELHPGDLICSQVYYYDLKSFVDSVDTFISKSAGRPA